jgi:peptide/nickel transport system substrate-binding protein
LATFLDYLRIGILPEHVLRGTTAAALGTHPFNLAPIGTGPYQFDTLLGDGKHLRGLRLQLSASYMQRPEAKGGYSFQKIVFRCYPTWNDAVAAFQRGEVNTVGEIPPEAVEQVSGLPLMPYPSYRPALGAVIYNWQRDSVNFFRDQRMRKALAQSIDRRALVDQFLVNRAVVADSPILPSSWAYAPGTTCPTFNPEEPNAAKDALTQVQIVPPTPDPNAATADPGAPTPQLNLADNSVVYRFELLVPNDAALLGLAQDMQKSWNALGLQVTLMPLDRVTLRERLAAGKFDAALVELNLAPSADPDPYGVWRQLPKEGGLNFGGLNERRLSELVEMARRASNGSYRVELYREFQQLFCDRAAALLLYYPVYYYGADVRIAGIQLGYMSEPSDRFRTIREWRFVQG